MTRYTVVGAGAIGGTLAVHLHRAGADVQIVDADEAHVRAIAERGLRVEQPGGAIEARIPVMTPENAPEKLDAVLLAVKAQATDAVSAWIAPRLADDGWVASLQNGLNEPVIARHVGADRTVAAFIDLFADVIEPGVVRDGVPATSRSASIRVVTALGCVVSLRISASGERRSSLATPPASSGRSLDSARCSSPARSATTTWVTSSTGTASACTH